MDIEEIDVSLANRLISSQFPEWAELNVRRVSTDGHDNRTFHLGDRMSIRLPTGKAYANHVAIEQEWLPRLASQLAIPITTPIAMGNPGCGYPWPWSVNRWISGETAAHEKIVDLSGFARELAGFLNALQRIDSKGAPNPGPENFFRGGELSVYDSGTRQSIAELSGRINQGAATEIWDASLETKYSGPSVWTHGDISPGNLIVSEGKLKGVIDFGQLAAGDPSCDLAIAWTFFSGESREAFRESLIADDSDWIRGRGWALWKALITLDSSQSNFDTAALWTIEEIIQEYCSA